MKLKSIIIFLIFFLSASIFAQNIYVCESYTDQGNPIGIINILGIGTIKKSVNILIDNEKKLDSDILYLFIDKLNDGKFSPYDSKILKVEKEKFWASIKYEFKETGVYEISFLNSSEKKLANSKFEVKYENEAGGSGRALFIFCDMIVNDRPVNPISQLSLSEKNGETYVFINNYVAFSTDKIIVKIWKRTENKSEYKELISTKKFKVRPKWSKTFFKLTFDEIGDYKIDVNDSNNKLIVSNILDVTE
ncbi:MAG: hypothetical protein IPH62_04750 [Ignavibacteriae bacterium]|nr:hypothetical protein [Ignavibacteriota bacterium]